MKNSRTYYPVLSFLVVFAAFHLVVAQSPEEDYHSSRLVERKFDQKAWEQITEGIDYSADPEDTGENSTAEEDFRIGIIKFLILGTAVLIILIVLRQFLGIGYRSSPKRFTAVPMPGIRKLERVNDQMDQIDFGPLIGQAISERKFSLAIRLYYLKILQELHNKKYIFWKRQKTNRDYVAELRGRPFFPGFVDATEIFERTWYGKRPMDENSFRQAEAQFRAFSDKINATPGQ